MRQKNSPFNHSYDLAAQLRKRRPRNSGKPSIGQREAKKRWDNFAMHQEGEQRLARTPHPDDAQFLRNRRKLERLLEKKQIKALFKEVWDE